ncbi:hypothetical protein VTL71DRAFT_13819 [Oculimacula yallundae]|uniref:Uncharacterized protein n=1 Tax=Oculimacula yallundae TaxID=86028 RepID=A0ABR4CNC9_9HELO
MHSPKPPREKAAARNLNTGRRELSPEPSAGDINSSQIQLIICSCSTHLIQPNNIHILNPHYPSLPLPTLPTLTSLLSAFLPSAISSFSSPLSYLNNLTKTFHSTTKSSSSPDLTAFQLAQAHVQTNNIPSRAGRYLTNPFEIPGLINRTRINVQSLLSIRLLFNIWCVVVWVLIRRFLEIFGIRIGGNRGP